MLKLNLSLPIGGWKRILFADIILLFIVGYRVLVPLFLENIELCLDSIELKKKLISPDKVMTQIKGLETINRKIEEKSREIIQAIPAGSESSRIYEILGRTAEIHKVLLQKIIPEPIERKDKLNRLSIDSFIKADFENLIRFLFEIESETGIFQIQKIGIEAGTGYQSELNAQLRLSSYLR